MVGDLTNGNSLAATESNACDRESGTQLENYLMSDTLLSLMYNDWKPVLDELEHFHRVYRSTKRRSEKISWDVVKRIVPYLIELKGKYNSFLNRNPKLCKSVDITISTYRHYNCGKRVSKKGSSGMELAKDLEILYEELTKSMESLVTDTTISLVK